ncbi:MAG: hypothetical protein AB7E30_09595, partial [Lawsonibacter sp.]
TLCKQKKYCTEKPGNRTVSGLFRALFSGATQPAETVSEYMKLLDAAPLLKVQGQDEEYRLLAAFNGVVLAGHPTRLGVQFVTWDWDYGHTGVSQGHYMSNHYEAAGRQAGPLAIMKAHILISVKLSSACEQNSSILASMRRSKQPVSWAGLFY